MISIYKAIKLNDVETITYLINLASSSQQVNKETQSWLPRYLRTTNQKHYNLNRRSTMGKTALHYAITWNRLEIAKLLIECPLVNINKRDLENGWSPLHRALYLGRMEMVGMLLKREDLDLSIKDWEGYKALELFSTTTSDSGSLLRKLETPTGPIMDMHDQTWTKDNRHLSTNQHHTTQGSLTRTAMRQGGTDLYTWGMNATYILGHLDTENRSRPERVPLYLESQQEQQTTLVNVLQQHVIESVCMSKFHMAILTSESRHNLLVCGFGRGGRLGTGKDTDAQLAPLPVRWPERIVDVAVGRDHTIAVTTSGSVITFGNNHYGQLGYDTEVNEEGYSSQLHPRKIQAPSIKKQPIVGVAASKVHSVAFTSTELFTFGYNQGQLGYHYMGNERRQVIPRKVVYSSNIHQVVATDFSTTILFENHDVVTLANFETQKLIFPTSRFPGNITVHSPANNYIVKLVSDGNIYTAALSNLGDVFIWSCKPSTPLMNTDIKMDQHRSKQATAIISTPRRIWTGSRADLGATSVGIGQDGEIIICTVSGQVYIGGLIKENAKDGKFKFQYIPQLQRCVSVCANPNGAYAAIRSEYQLPLPRQHCSTLAMDLLHSLPCMTMASPVEKRLEQLQMEKKRSLDSIDYMTLDNDTEDPDAEKSRRKQQIEQQYNVRARRIVDDTWKQLEQETDPTLDICFWVQGKPIYSHFCILEGRRNKNRKSSLLVDSIGDKSSPINKSSGHIKFVITRQSSSPDRYDVVVEGCHLLSFFVLMEYVYGDTIAYFSTRHIPVMCTCFGPHQQPDLQEVRYDLIHLSSLLGLSQLHECVSSTYLPTPPSTLAIHLTDMQSQKANGDVELVLKNGTVICHEVILRQRCPFFGCLFNSETLWMDMRRSRTLDGSTGPTQINLNHHYVEVMSCLVHYLYGDPQSDVDLCIPSAVSSAEEIMHFLLGLLGAADEFLLPGLKVLCERALIPMVNVRSVIMILECAHLYLAPNLKLACLTLIHANMSSFVIAGLLEHISLDLLRDLETFVRGKQADSFPFVDRSPKTTTNDDDLDLQMALATWTKEETPITAGYIEYLETTKPTITNQSSLLIDNNVSLVESEQQSHQHERKKKTKKKGSIKKGVPISVIHQQSEQQHDLTSSPPISETGWGLTPSHAESSQNKPSLRDLLEKEEAELAILPLSLPKVTIGPSKKLSQKEKRKLQQQELLSLGTVEPPNPKTSVWGTIPTVSAPSTISTQEEILPLKSNANENTSRSTGSKGVTKEKSTKGKKIFTTKESILEEHQHGWRRTDITDINVPILFDAQRTYGGTFTLIPRTPLPTKSNNTASSSSGDHLRRGSSSFHAIQQEQKLQDDWIKNKRTKNLLRIQQEETAMEGLREFYIQTLNRGSGEWIDIHPSL
ncbi:hypothetical protein BC941DRAFT_437618 [Chlamydoabsidia padenii]|nr:hypothetical protein BC941DRAFT_437618 [Chlamydoabsidia padenii]